MCVQALEVAEEKRQNDTVSPPSFSSSGELTGTTENVFIALNILDLPLLNLLLGLVKMETFFPPHPEEGRLIC